MGNDAAFVGNIPLNYDQGLGPVIFADYAADIAQRAAALKPARVLETAAGTGIVSRALRDALPASAHLVSTDLNPPMLEVARGKFRPGEQIDFQRADAMALPFGEASFDVVVCQFGIMFYPDRDKSHREVHRVLRPGGTYLFNVWGSLADNAYGRIAHENVRRFFPADPPQFYQVPFSCHDTGPIKEGLARAGFVDVAEDEMSMIKDIADINAFARGLVYGNPMIDQITQRGTIDPKDVFDALLATLRQEFGNPGRMSLKTFLLSARKPS
ncbi:MAG TPA: methyltransferase domain-containing protein [Pseudorhodoplanes sp.]|jgi:ubiquinone/menaquinone biosynthesis C-methylase UbiE|nr:methyltransferase domain-containing protein [Pseudorhodoplanes sp.]